MPLEHRVIGKRTRSRKVGVPPGLPPGYSEALSFLFHCVPWVRSCVLSQDGAFSGEMGKWVKLCGWICFYEQDIKQTV